jgi:hypothetical protein
MTLPKPTKEDAEQLINARKIISGSISWKPVGGIWRLEAKALEPGTNTILKLNGYIGTNNYSFALLHKNCPIRKFTKHDKHKFNGIICRVPHKHLWSELTEDKEIYVPVDINPQDNINKQFLDFCRECNIELKGGYQPVLYEFGR